MTERLGEEMRRRIRRRSARRKQKVLNTILNIALVGCLAIFVFSGWKLISSLIEYRKGEENYEALLQDAVISPGGISDGTQSNGYSQEEILPVIDWAKLKNMNNDLIGWLYIPDTVIQYPIVASTDNDYYLTHTFDRTENACGSIFMDKGNKKDFSSDNTILHGHNMKNGTMFGSLREFEEKSYWQSHPYIWIIRENIALKYEIFSVGITEAASDVYILEFGSEESFRNYIVNRTKLGAIYETGVNVTTNDKLLTLSTCTSDTEVGRRVVQAKLVDEKVIR